MPSAASSCLGRMLVRGRLPLRVGADADVVLVGVLAVAAHGHPGSARHVPSIPAHISGKSGRVLAVVATFSTCTPSHGQADDRAGGGQPVVLVGVEDAAVQRARADAQAVGGLGDVAAELVDLLGERGQPVRLVQPQVGDAAQRGRGVGERRDRRDARGQLADLAQVDVDAVDRGRSR